MTAPQWFSGPPPAVGWWPASSYGLFRGVYRWWDGEVWSEPAFDYMSKKIASRIANLPCSDYSSRVLWCEWSLSIDGTDGKGAHE